MIIIINTQINCVGKEKSFLTLHQIVRELMMDGNIMMDLLELGCGHMDWIGLAQNRDRWRTLVSAVMHLRVP